MLTELSCKALLDRSPGIVIELSSAQIQLDDVPRTPIQQSFTGELRQHDGVMTVMMLLPTQGFA